MGALSFEPSSDDPHTPVDWALQQLAQEVQNVVQGQDGETLQQLITLGGSPQGARPKALVQRVPMHTLAGALHADYRIPSCDYLTLLRMTRLMTIAKAHAANTKWTSKAKASAPPEHSSCAWPTKPGCTPRHASQFQALAMQHPIRKDTVKRIAQVIQSHIQRLS